MNPDMNPDVPLAPWQPGVAGFNEWRETPRPREPESSELPHLFRHAVLSWFDSPHDSYHTLSTNAYLLATETTAGRTTQHTQDEVRALMLWAIKERSLAVVVDPTAVPSNRRPLFAQRVVGPAPPTVAGVIGGRDSPVADNDTRCSHCRATGRPCVVAASSFQGQLHPRTMYVSLLSCRPSNTSELC